MKLIAHGGGYSSVSDSGKLKVTNILFFFLIGNKTFIASKKAMSQVYRKYTELTVKHYSMQESKNSKIEEKEDEPIFYSIQLGPFEALCEIVILFLLIFFVP